MTATARIAKRNRFLSVRFRLRDDSRELCGVVVTDGQKQDIYGIVHNAGSCEVLWHHEDGSRDYTVTCSASTGEPIRCTCPARLRPDIAPCRHRAATAALTENGYLDLPTLTDAGHDRSTTE